MKYLPLDVKQLSINQFYLKRLGLVFEVLWKSEDFILLAAALGMLGCGPYNIFMLIIYLILLKPVRLVE